MPGGWLKKFTANHLPISIMGFSSHKTRGIHAIKKYLNVPPIWKSTASGVFIKIMEKLSRPTILFMNGRSDICWNSDQEYPRSLSCTMPIWDKNSPTETTGPSPHTITRYVLITGKITKIRINIPAVAGSKMRRMLSLCLR